MQAYVLRTDTLVIGVYAEEKAAKAHGGHFTRNSQRDVPRDARPDSPPRAP